MILLRKSIALAVAAGLVSTGPSAALAQVRVGRGPVEAGTPPVAPAFSNPPGLEVDLSLTAGVPAEGPQMPLLTAPDLRQQIGSPSPSSQVAVPSSYGNPLQAAESPSMAPAEHALTGQEPVTARIPALPAAENPAPQGPQEPLAEAVRDAREGDPSSSGNWAGNLWSRLLGWSGNGLDALAAHSHEHGHDHAAGCCGHSHEHAHEVLRPRVHDDHDEDRHDEVPAPRVRSALRDMTTEDAPVSPFIDPYRASKRWVTGLGITHAILTVVIAKLAGTLINAVVAHDLWLTSLVSAGTVALLLAFLTFDRFYDLLLGQTAQDVARDMRVSTFRKLLGMPEPFIRSEKPGEIARRLTDNMVSLTRKNLETPAAVPGQLTLLALSAGMLFWVNPWLFPVVLASALAVGWLSGRFGAKNEALSDALEKRNAEMTNHIVGTLAQLETVQGYGAEDREAKRFGATAEKVHETGYELARVRADWHAISHVLTDIFVQHGPRILAAFFLVLSLVLGLPGDVAVVGFFAAFIKEALGALSQFYQNYKIDRGASKRPLEYMTMPLPDDPPGAVDPGRLSGRIELRDIRFAYDPAGRRVLDGLTLSIAPGQTVAIMGKNASGKSTLLRLLRGTLAPQEGSIEVFGDGPELEGGKADLSRLRRKSYWRQIAVVSQTEPLFPISIRENILYGKPDATDQELREAIRAAGADFALGFPKGLDTSVLERSLSGGERQKVLLARAFLTRPAILILDEATSEVDAASQRDIQESIRSLTRADGGGRPTVIMIAHHMNAVSAADMVVHLENGRVLPAAMEAEDPARGRGHEQADAAHQHDHRP